ncbi:MAG: outer membrane beta-barrel protein [Moritella sp.]|uniref:outer membrane beta-barrel protein n=1 Tax=Moritella sp. TaxID=78556 RepID=UPI0029B77B95|nr:outer membrane beta-barrel protein [Moritella sp.]MDX2319754.1 outer membrane beta-barrel protein [Moritella sp.]
MKQLKIGVYWISLALISDGVLAYTQDVYITDGGVFVKPSLEMGIENDDNIYNQESGTSSSLITTIIPTINLKIDEGINYYSLDAKAEKGMYEAGSVDNYTDALLGLNAHIEPNDTHRFDFSLKGEWLTEKRGTGITEQNFELTEEPIRYGKNTLSGAYEYGAMQTKGRIAVEVKYYEKEYSNFASITDRSNYDSLLLGSTFYYSTRAHTDAFIEVSAETIGYDYNQPGEFKRDSDVYTGFVGMQWKASPIVHGFIKLGVQAKEFEDTGREDFTGFSWNIGGVWRPLSYSKLTFSTSQTTKDPDLVGDYILDTKYKLDWKHNWMSYFYSSVGVYKYKDDYSGTSRVDDTLGFKLKFGYDITENVAVSLFGIWDSNTSTNTQFEYDKNVVGTSFILTL